MFVYKVVDGPCEREHYGQWGGLSVNDDADVDTRSEVSHVGISAPFGTRKGHRGLDKAGRAGDRRSVRAQSHETIVTETPNRASINRGLRGGVTKKDCTRRKSACVEGAHLFR